MQDECRSVSCVGSREEGNMRREQPGSPVQNSRADGREEGNWRSSSSALQLLVSLHKTEIISHMFTPNSTVSHEHVKKFLKLQLAEQLCYSIGFCRESFLFLGCTTRVVLHCSSLVTLTIKFVVCLSGPRARFGISDGEHCSSLYTWFHCASPAQKTHFHPRFKCSVRLHCDTRALALTR